MTRLLIPRPIAAVMALLALSAGALGCAPLSARVADAPVPQPAFAAVSASMSGEAAAPAVVAAAPTPPRLVAWGPTPSLVAGAASAPSLFGDSAILIDEASGVALFEKDPHTRLPAASLTKIMTALVALERGHLSDTVEVSIDSRTMRGSTVMGLVPGERLTLEDLLYGLMLPSGNDAALAIAQHISGSTEAFVAVMNQRAAELGMINTRYTNPHGLDQGGPYTSAFDLAVLTRAGMQREDFRTIVNTKYRVVTGSIGTYQLGTLNPLYGRLAGVDGVKTGYTRTARQTLVGSVMRDGHRVYAVVMRSEDRASDGVVLFNWTFDSYTWAGPTTVASDSTTVPGT